MDKKYKQNLIEFFKDIKNKNITKRQLQNLKIKFSKKYNIPNIPLTSDILEALQIKKAPRFLVTKPTKTLSGVTVVAVMTKPLKCPGKCIYCPNSKIAPRSYTGFEPAAMRAKRNDFDPAKQIKDRLHQFESIGHPTNKIELIIMGGTILAATRKYQDEFVTKIYQAITESKSNNFSYLKKKAMISKRRMIGLTFETRPDYCNRKMITNMLNYGGTRVELGVQIVDDNVLEFVNRGHDVATTIKATKELKDSGFKVLYHMMLGLPGSSYKNDLKYFKKIFSDPRFCPDMIKIYPCLVTKGTKIEDMMYEGTYKPYDTKTMAKLIAEIKEYVPKWVRIMRVQRDIPATKIIAGVKHSNLRQIVHEILAKNNKKCNCIRCCEPKGVLKSTKGYKVKIIDYDASNGKEYFIYAEKDEYLLGFIRLRFPDKPFIESIKDNTALIRELHVYGQNTSFDDKNIQHTGIGKKLLKKAEEISKKHKYIKLAVISGIGVREYYKKQGYELVEPYMIKKL